MHVAKERRRPALKAPERKAPPKEGAAVERKPRVKQPSHGLGLGGLGGDGGGDAVTWDGGVRKSSRASVQEIRSKSEMAREAAKAKPAPRRNLNAEPVKALTQAEILADAAITEVRNLADLERLLRMEEVTKKKAERVKVNYRGPALRVKSSGPTTTMELRFGARMPPPLG